MPESVIILPPDSTGKSVRTFQKSVAGILVHTEAMWQDEPYAILGRYAYTTMSAMAGVVASNNYVSFMISSGPTIAVIKKIHIEQNIIGPLTGGTSLLVSRIGSAAGGTLVTATTIGKKDTNDPDPLAIIRTANPTMGLGNDMMAFMTPTSSSPYAWDWTSQRPSDDIICRSGQGIAIRGILGNTNERLLFNFEWLETREALSMS